MKDNRKKKIKLKNSFKHIKKCVGVCVCARGDVCADTNSRRRLKNFRL